ncbi:hypothetical protein GW17_00006316 [Ensete ventricosum]|nr:hypothetical protein GW17_00006316 [Ensete ventricosum]
MPCYLEVGDSRLWVQGQDMPHGLISDSSEIGLVVLLLKVIHLVSNRVCNIIPYHSERAVIAESLSEEEIGGLKELFKMIDTDNSGTITFDELKAGLRRVGSELMESEIQTLMDAVWMTDIGCIPGFAIPYHIARYGVR